MNGNGGSGTSDKSLLSVGGQSYVTPGGVDKTRAALTWCVTRPPSWKSSTPSSPTRSARRRKRGSARVRPGDAASAARQRRVDGGAVVQPA